jgi:drug/metabolite transporter (DMT)-like permease
MNMAKAQLKIESPKDESAMNAFRGKGKANALVILAFAAIYLIWGSTYLAIRFGIETLPPFFMAASRFLIAGSFLFVWAGFNGATVRQPFPQWRRAFVVGALLLLCGNGGVTWAEKYVASGLAALVVATEPLWVVVLKWVLDRKRPNLKVILGVFLGMAGVALLVGSGLRVGVSGGLIGVIGMAVVFASSLAWASGSVYANRNPIKAPTSLASGMQMLAGGSLLLIASFITGDFKKLNLANASWLSIVAFAYLVIFGSIVAFTAYSWLLRNVSPARAATYAYVNPVVAVFLGWLLASEPLTPRMLIAAAVIVGSLVLITTYGEDTQRSDTSVRSDTASSKKTVYGKDLVDAKSVDYRRMTGRDSPAKSAVVDSERSAVEGGKRSVVDDGRPVVDGGGVSVVDDEGMPAVDDEGVSSDVPCPTHPCA